MKLFKPRWTRCFSLDDPEKALDEFTAFCHDFIALIIYNSPNPSDSLVRAANRAAKPISTNLAEGVPKKRVLFITDPKVLEKVEEKIRLLLQPTGVAYEDAVAFSVVKGTEQVAFVIPKEELKPLEMGSAFNRAIIELERLT